MFKQTLIAAAVTASSLVQAETAVDDKIIVTATRTSQTVDEALAPVTLITRC